MGLSGAPFIAGRELSWNARIMEKTQLGRAIPCFPRIIAGENGSVFRPMAAEPVRARRLKKEESSRLPWAAGPSILRLDKCNRGNRMSDAVAVALVIVGALAGFALIFAVFALMLFTYLLVYKSFQKSGNKLPA